MEKLIIKREPEFDKGAYVMLNVYSQTKAKIKELSKSTGKPMAELAALMIDFAIENLEIVDRSDK